MTFFVQQEKRSECHIFETNNNIFLSPRAVLLRLRNMSLSSTSEEDEGITDSEYTDFEDAVSPAEAVETKSESIEPVTQKISVHPDLFCLSIQSKEKHDCLHNYEKPPNASAETIQSVLEAVLNPLVTTLNMWGAYFDYDYDDTSSDDEEEDYKNDQLRLPDVVAALHWPRCNITSLDLTESTLWNIDSIGNLPTRVTSLRLSFLGGMDNEGPGDFSLDPIGKLTHLTTLDLTGMDNHHWSDFENLKALTRLTELHLPTVQSSLDMIKSIGGLTNLTSLDFECYCDTKKSRKLFNKVFPALSRLTTLRTSIHNVDCLQKCDSLTTLAVTTSGVVDISSLQYLTNLTDLDLNTCEQLEDIGTVLLLTNLKSLDLRWTAIKSIYPLRTLTNLTSLDVAGTRVSSTNVYNSMACSFPDGFVKRIASGFNLRHAATLPDEMRQPWQPTLAARVFAASRIEASNKILPGVISSVHADETFDIELSTGEQLEKIPREQILPCAPQQCMVEMMGATIDEQSLEMMEITATMLSDEKNCMRSHTIAGMYQVLHSAKVARYVVLSRECMVVGMMALHRQHPRLYELIGPFRLRVAEYLFWTTDLTMLQLTNVFTSPGV